MARVLNLVMSELVGGNSYLLMPWRAIEKKKHRQKTRTGARTTRPYVFLFFFLASLRLVNKNPT